MNIKTLVLSVIELAVKIVILALLLIYIFKGVTWAYDFGYSVFADVPLSSTNGKTITVAILEDSDVKSIATMLEEKGLIADAKLFIVQEYLSSYHEKEVPGIYDLSTSMTANEMLAIISGNGPEGEEISSYEGSVSDSELTVEEGGEESDSEYETSEEEIEPNADTIITE